MELQKVMSLTWSLLISGSLKCPDAYLLIPAITMITWNFTLYSTTKSCHRLFILHLTTETGQIQEHVMPQNKPCSAYHWYQYMTKRFLEFILSKCFILITIKYCNGKQDNLSNWLQDVNPIIMLIRLTAWKLIANFFMWRQILF